jgi:hypothetical protein
VCVCVSLSVISCNNNPLHLRRVGRSGQTKNVLICLFIYLFIYLHVTKLIFSSSVEVCEAECFNYK